jgi:hypothetical protein
MGEEMVGACSMHVKNENAYKILIRIPGEKASL